MPKEKYDLSLTHRHEARQRLRRAFFMFFCLWGVFAAFLLLTNEAEGQSSKPVTECQRTPKAYTGGLSTRTSPEKLCEEAFGEEWDFTSGRPEVQFVRNDVQATNGAEGWCKHQIYNCGNWSTQRPFDSGTTCTTALLSGTSRGLLGVRKRTQCNEKQPIWCCKTNPDGGLQ